MDGFDKHDDLNDEVDSRFRQEIYSKAIRAGKRTYFFDVKSTRKDEYYLTITESKKRFDQDGKYHFEKHKIFLYKEDFEKFTDGLSEVIEFISGNQPIDYSEQYNEPETASAEEQEEDLVEEVVVAEKDYTSVEFEDLAN